MELWDVYDIHRRKLGYKIARCTPDELPADCEYRPALAPSGKLNLRPEEYHLSVHVWFINSKGELLIQKRAENKRHMPGVWAACGGAAMSGESTIDAAIRESYEEMGIIVDPARLIRILTYTAPERHSHMDVYIYKYECDPATLTLQTEEVSRAGWFSLDELTGKCFTDEQFRRYTYMDILYEFVKFNVKWQRAGFIDPGATRKLDEIVDIFDIRGGATGRTMLRGSAQPYGDYFRAVQVWFIGSDGSVLLQRRSMRCAFKPGYFAVTGGVLKSGETELEAARREVREELGLTIDERNMFCLCAFIGKCSHYTVYVVNQDVQSDELRLQKEEVASVEFVSADMLNAYSDADNFLRPPYMPMVISAMRVMERARHG
ncbi:MAG: NUDIX domain-containing protein [Christensenellales bacterium]